MPTLSRALSAAIAMLLIVTASADAQPTARVRSTENFRRDPNGEILAVLEAGAALNIVGRREQWIEAEFEGWVWTRSLQVNRQGAFNLVVSEPRGENLRAAPSGDIVGKLDAGTVLMEQERVPGWVRVRRRGWIWSASVVETAAAPAAAGASPAASRPSAAPPGPTSRNPAGFRRIATRAPILASPDGDTLAVAQAGSELQVTAREGNWVRVRLEGWAWMPETGDSSGPDWATALTPEALASDPEAHRGRVVQWALQFISIERAEKVRTDFFEGEPFLLCRFGGTDGPFVYVAVPPERLTELEALTPLERISITGRVRTGASTLTNTPIVDLLALERARQR